MHQSRYEQPEVRQWQCGGNEELKGHELAMARCRYEGTVHMAKGASLVFWCEDYEILEPGHVQLNDCIIDNSTRFQGVTMTKRLTWYDWVDFIDCSIMILPFSFETAAQPKEGE